MKFSRSSKGAKGKLQVNYKNHIGGKWVKTAHTFESHNPATGEKLGELFEAKKREVRQATKAARSAFQSWRLVPAPKRADLLYRFAQLLEQRKADLARTLTLEMGKVIAEAAGDVQEAIDIAYYMAGEGRRSFGSTVPSELPNKFAMSVRQPVGVCGLITPWNFPIAIPAWKSMPALVLGNTVVWKPSQYTSITAVKLVEVFEEAGFPAGVVNLLLGTGANVGHAMVNDPEIDLISFTGSNAVGTKLASDAAALGKRVSLEMGGKNAVLVMEDADLDLAVDGILWAAFGTTGQRCTAASRVLAHRKIKADLAARMAARARKMKLGPGMDSKTDVGPLINAHQLARVEEYVQIGRKEGAHLLCGGHRATQGALAKGYFFEPTLFDRVRPEMRIAQEEIFGPVVSILTVKDLDEAVQINNSVPFGLSASIFTRDVNRAFAAMRDLHTGIVYVNAGTTGAEVQLPFGGTKGTGNGHREAGQAALDTFSEWKSLYVDYSGKIQRAQIDNHEDL
ncbi:MAG: aldehyde dehydrogenase family protein [Verrucomicrobiae bacterium]|nr:aldehyde dehydrogenase family protein [Verrucomicrobiae bacterium]